MSITEYAIEVEEGGIGEQMLMAAVTKKRKETEYAREEDLGNIIQHTNEKSMSSTYEEEYDIDDGFVDIPHVMVYDNTNSDVNTSVVVVPVNYDSLIHTDVASNNTDNSLFDNVVVVENNVDVVVAFGEERSDVVGGQTKLSRFNDDKVNEALQKTKDILKLLRKKNKKK